VRTGGSYEMDLGMCGTPSRIGGVVCANITVPGKAEGRQNARCLMALAGPPRRGPAGSVTRDQSKGID
jgi:hypothetical protein